MIKKLVTHNHTIRDLDCMENIIVGDHRTVIIEGKLPPKLKDPGSFVLTGDVGEVKETWAM